jgi:hypothetical protein
LKIMLEITKLEAIITTQNEGAEVLAHSDDF